MNTAIEQYIRELSDLLCCDKTTKQQFLSKFQQNNPVFFVFISVEKTPTSASGE